MGTPDYIAPEQALESHTVDIRGDLYSLGCSFYYLLTGQVPFPGGTLLQKLNNHQFEEPQPIEQLRPDVPSSVAAVVRKLMAKKPSDRYQTPAELATALAAVSHQSSFATVANRPTPASQAEADTLASAFAYMAKRDDMVGFEPMQEKTKNRRWLMVGAIGSLFLVGLVVVAVLFFKNPSSENKPSANKDVPVQVKKKEPPKYFTNSIGMKFVWIPPGNFVMGSPENEAGRKAGEAQHKITLTKGFYMGVYEVTQEQWETVMGKNPSKFKGEKNLPVELVSWDDCQEFVKKLRETDKKPYRLPTEAEWEYACRSGTTTAYYFGDDNNMLGQHAWYSKNSGAKTHPVGQKKSNQWGLYDMHGNVWEWCQDCFGDYPQEDVTEPQGPEKGTYRVLRGGSWFGFPEDCRSAFRYRYEPGFRFYTIGCRVCFCLEEEDPIVVPKIEAAVPPNPFTNSLGMKFVWIPPGTFLMGSPKEEIGRQADETQHKVTLTKGVYMGVYGVTQEQWETVKGNNPSRFKGEQNRPVEQVSWNDCQQFIKKLREKDKKLYRLPTEAEWEYACRAGTTTKYYFGDDAETLSEYAWSNVNSSGKTHPVGQKKPNAFGLYEMHGNVWEWCQDWFGDYQQEDVVDPQGPSIGQNRVLRGGSWNDTPEHCRSASRSRAAPGPRINYIGCRVCFCLD